MTTHVSYFLKVVTKWLVALLVTAIMLLSMTQTAVLAESAPTETVGIPGITKPISAENDSETREQRREWQSKASNLKGKANEPETLGEKLNVEEITEGFDPEREAEKRSKPTP
ncbi:MAG: hypothetical protein KME15_25755 [Drouetiella hepatica Uher 2000/2452]|jgi:hypothetical protein|uniref:Uncharacterized protein n=1 Tax=Drouetiella hepatica Uher 2000/2452 TaxID=904376 RepID=A0A951UPZ9_9CYAN|nr:hypothetical protein [Drouetiella hepatica Uher 2000/2452]